MTMAAKQARALPQGDAISALEEAGREPTTAHHIFIEGVVLDREGTNEKGVSIQFEAPVIDLNPVLEAVHRAMRGSLFNDHVVDEVAKMIIRSKTAEFLAGRVKTAYEMDERLR